jgi:hypothetical protein
MYDNVSHTIRTMQVELVERKRNFRLQKCCYKDKTKYRNIQKLSDKHLSSTGDKHMRGVRDSLQYHRRR